MIKLIYLKSALKCNSFDVTIGIKICSITIEPGRSLLQFVTTNCLIKADKSNSLVVDIRQPYVVFGNTTGYDTIIYAHINDKTTYATITKDHTDQFANKIELKDLKQNGKIAPHLCNKFFPRGSFCPKF